MKGDSENGEILSFDNDDALQVQTNFQQSNMKGAYNMLLFILTVDFIKFNDFDLHLGSPFVFSRLSVHAVHSLKRSVPHVPLHVGTLYRFVPFSTASRFSEFI